MNWSKPEVFQRWSQLCKPKCCLCRWRLQTLLNQAFLDDTIHNCFHLASISVLGLLPLWLPRWMIYNKEESDGGDPFQDWGWCQVVGGQEQRATDNSSPMCWFPPANTFQLSTGHPCFPVTIGTWVHWLELITKHRLSPLFPAFEPSLKIVPCSHTIQRTVV